MRRPSTGNSRPRAEKTSASVADPRRLFEEKLPLIERVIASICRRQGLFEEEAEEFASWARIKLLENDCAILGKFGGRSSLKTFLVTVVHNLFRDYRISQWGRWRPSAMAKRLGVVAVQMERLLHRDGIGFDQAAETLQRNFGVRQSLVDLADLAGRLPARTSRRVDGVEDEEELARLSPAGRARPEGTEARVRRSERREQAAEMERCLARAFEELEPEDRVVLRLRFEQGMTVAAISRTLTLEQKPLYRRIERCLAVIRTCLEDQGVTAETVAELVGWDELSLDVAYGDDER